MILSIRQTKFFLLLIMLMLFTGCAESSIISSEQGSPENLYWGIAMEQFNCPIDFPPDSELIYIADQILDGKMVVLYSMEDALEYNMKEMDRFDWDIQYSNAPNTFQLYLQCLNPIAYLAKAYELSGNENYLLQAEVILDSWLDYKNTPQGKSFSLV